MRSSRHHRRRSSELERSDATCPSPTCQTTRQCLGGGAPTAAHPAAVSPAGAPATTAGKSPRALATRPWPGKWPGPPPPGGAGNASVSAPPDRGGASARARAASKGPPRAERQCTLRSGPEDRDVAHWRPGGPPPACGPSVASRRWRHGGGGPLGPCDAARSRCPSATIAGATASWPTAASKACIAASVRRRGLLRGAAAPPPRRPPEAPCAHTRKGAWPSEPKGRSQPGTTSTGHTAPYPGQGLSQNAYGPRHRQRKPMGQRGRALPPHFTSARRQPKRSTPCGRTGNAMTKTRSSPLSFPPPPSIDSLSTCLWWRRAPWQPKTGRSAARARRGSRPASNQDFLATKKTNSRFTSTALGFQAPSLFGPEL